MKATLRVLAITLVAALWGCGLAAPGLAADSAPAAQAAVPDTTTPIDLNAAPLTRILELPIPRALAEAIVEHRTYRAYFSSLFDLLEVEGMTAELLERVRNRVFITPSFEAERRERDEDERRAEELDYLVQRLLSEEGASEGLTDDLVDQVRDPRDLNRLSFFDLLSYPNMSPVDAVAILRERTLAGRIENARQLRGAQGLSGWGYRNLRNFVRYEDRGGGRRRLKGDYQLRLYNTPYVLDDADILDESIVGSDPNRNYDLNTYSGRLDLRSNRPFETHKLRLRWGNHLKGGLVTHRNLGEQHWDETRKGFVGLEDVDGPNTSLGPLKLRQLVLGSYTVAFGQGLVMDATDHFMPRRTGAGYTPRSVGLRGDLSRTDEFALRGVGVEGSIGALQATAFYSRDDKDAILNPADSSFNSYIRMVPRLSNELLDDIRRDIVSGKLAGGDPTAFLPMRDVMDERVAGLNLRVSPFQGTVLGATGVEIVTRNRLTDSPAAQRWNARDTTLITRLDKLDPRDSEIAAGYRSLALGDYRRVWGLEGQTVWRNLGLAAEYGKLETSDARGTLDRIFSAGPEAFVTSAQIQYENLTLLALYRDYDLGYDNPYSRGFSEDSRYEQTLLDGNAFYLRNPYWAQLSRGLPQPKAEHGIYLSGRYQISRSLTLSGIEYDAWTRKADGADLRRLVTRAEYRPIYPIRFRIRHAISSRHADRPDDIRAYTSWDSRIEMMVNLSSFDQIRFLLSTSNLTFGARGRLSGPPYPGDTQADTTAKRGIPARALQAAVTHNFSPHLSATLSTEIYDGFLYNYEDNEFVVVDGKGFRNWFLLHSRISDRLSWRLKWTSNHPRVRTYVDVRDFGAAVTPTPDAVSTRGDASAFRFQLDCAF